ncbi:MAG: MFS transporter [Clostridia bacterium]|nr:MFS transporter [Clostridia bacterium]
MIKSITQYRGLPRQIYLLLIARTVIAMSSFIFPFLTLFLSSRLHMSDMEIGRYLLFVSLSYIPAALIGGKLADKLGRKWVYFFSMVFADIACFISGFYYQEAMVIYILIAGFFFMNMGMPVLSAMMMDLTHPGNRQESFSLIYLGYNLGFAFGPLIAGLLFEHYIQWIFWGQALLNLAAMSLIAIFVKDTKPGQNEIEALAQDANRAKERASGESLLQSLFHAPEVLLFALFGSLYAFAYAELGFVLPLQMADIFGAGAGSKLYGVIWSLNGLFVFLLTPLTVLMFKKRPPLLNLSFAGICYLVGMGLYSLISSLPLFYLMVAVWTLGEVVGATNSGVFIANHSPISHRARYQSIYDIIQGSGRAIGPLLVGIFLMSHSYADAWRLVALLCLISAASFYIMYRYYHKKEQRSLEDDPAGVPICDK